MAAGFSGERQFSGRAFFTCLMISLSVMGFGYPTAILGTTLSQPSFLSYMHLIDEEGKSTSNATQLIGATSGVYQVSVDQQRGHGNFPLIELCRLAQPSVSSS